MSAKDCIENPRFRPRPGGGLPHPNRSRTAAVPKAVRNGHPGNAHSIPPERDRHSPQGDDEKNTYRFPKRQFRRAAARSTPFGEDFDAGVEDIGPGGENGPCKGRAGIMQSYQPPGTLILPCDTASGLLSEERIRRQYMLQCSTDPALASNGKRPDFPSKFLPRGGVQSGNGFEWRPHRVTGRRPECPKRLGTYIIADSG